jgi:hypothetical protein
VSTCEQVVFEFVGGPRDGERLCGCLDRGGLTEAGAFYRHTDGAKVCKQFWCPCEYSVTALRTIPWNDLEAFEAAGYYFRGHIYEIFVRWEKSRTLLVRTRHVCASE